MNSSCKEDRYLIGYRFYQILSRAWISKEQSFATNSSPFFSENLPRRLSIDDHGKKKKLQIIPLSLFSLTFQKNYLGKKQIVVPLFVTHPPSSFFRKNYHKLSLITIRLPEIRGVIHRKKRKKKKKKRIYDARIMERVEQISSGTLSPGEGWNSWMGVAAKQKGDGNKRMRWRWRAMVEGCSRYWGRCR